MVSQSISLISPAAKSTEWRGYINGDGAARVFQWMQVISTVEASSHSGGAGIEIDDGPTDRLFVLRHQPNPSHLALWDVFREFGCGLGEIIRDDSHQLGGDFVHIELERVSS